MQIGVIGAIGWGKTDNPYYPYYPHNPYKKVESFQLSTLNFQLSTLNSQLFSYSFVCHKMHDSESHSGRGFGSKLE